MNNRTIKRLGFYINEGFWAESKPDFSHINEKNWAVHEYMETMKAEVVSVADADRRVIIDKDVLKYRYC